MTTKAAILEAYRAQIAAYPWASDADKLERFMSAARNTLTPGAGEGTVDHHGHSWKRALELNGIFSAHDQALKRLRALPEA
jgi:hypothetical protein